MVTRSAHPIRAQERGVPGHRLIEASPELLRRLHARLPPHAPDIEHATGAVELGVEPGDEAAASLARGPVVLDPGLEAVVLFCTAMVVVMGLAPGAWVLSGKVEAMNNASVRET